MSQDLQTYSTLSALQKISTSESSPYVSQTDEAIVARLNNFGAMQGLGDEIYYPEEMHGMLDEFGVQSIINPNLSKE